MYSESILENWELGIRGYSRRIELLEDNEYPAWTVKLDDGYGVAIPYGGNEDILETFAGVKIYTKRIGMGPYALMDNALLLTASDTKIREPFSTLCSEFISPGKNGSRRLLVSQDPIAWWRDWKDLLGNRSVDLRTYDVLGELSVLKILSQRGENPSWNGPSKSSYDLECTDCFYEVKSTLGKNNRRITVSSQFQLDAKDKKLNLVLCLFEPTDLNGLSIETLVGDLVDCGFDEIVLNDNLRSLGFEKGRSARKRTFLLHDMLVYSVDGQFPYIAPDSFIEGIIPKGISNITYSVDLGILTSSSLLYEGNNEI